MLNFVNKFFGSSASRRLKSYSKTVQKINDFEKNLDKLSDLDLKNKTNEFRERIKKDQTLEEILPEAFAVVREASKRSLNLRHFDVQLFGGIVLHKGMITEMKTGEGKTLVATLAAYLNSLNGDPVHIITVNDYLADRDSKWMGNIYKFLGLSVGCINSSTAHESRLEQYKCDIVYATNNEIGFDYLRDNLKGDYESLCFKKDAFAIVDEVDSILIDESRTPLIISGKVEDKTTLYTTSNEFIKHLQRNDFELDEKNKNAILTDLGIDKIEKLAVQKKLLKNNNFYDPANLDLVHHINQALKANFLFKKDTDYIVRDGKVQIIDEFTGRVLDGRRFSDGLHQAIEAKENVKVEEENQTLASITYQNYFRLYNKLSGMTGTAMTESEEFYDIYKLNVVSIPTNKKMIRKDLNDQIFRTQAEKDDAIIKKIVEIKSKAQPILVFTSSINKSEHYSELLKKKKIDHLILNAKNHEREADIIANAGRLGSIIITTSISGRGVDIKLGGKENRDNQKDKIKKLGGLYIIGTERMESRRVDNQARGRSGRQGDEGFSIFYVSLEDDLMRIFGSESMNKMLEKLGLKDGESIDHPWINKALERAQQKVESRNFDIRKTLLKFDNVLNDQRQVIFEQRKKIILDKEGFNFTDKFIDEINSDFAKEKERYLINPKDNNFINKFKKIYGKMYKDNEILELAKKTGDDFMNDIKAKYIKNKNERIVLLGKKNYEDIEKKFFLQVIDQNWKLHIQYLEQLRQVIGLRSYGNRDPLIEYKKEAFMLFENLLEKLKTDFITIITNISIIKSEQQENNDKKKKIDPKFIGKKIGRNEPCFCGSKKKYKHCCGSL